MSAGDSVRYQINIKTPGGTLINLYAESDFELKDQLRSLTEHLSPDILAAEQVLTAVNNVTYTPPASQQQSPASEPPPFAQPQQGSYSQSSPVAQQPQQHGPSCQHGAMIYREGTSKSGAPYKAYFCPSQNRKNQCDPQWIR